MKTCVIDCGSAINHELLARMAEIGDVSYYDGIPKTVDEVVRRAGDADFIIFALMQFTNEMLDGLVNLKILQFMGTGVSNFVDQEYAEKKGIKVQNIRCYGSNAVAEFALGMAFAATRHIVKGDNEVSSGGFNNAGMEGVEISGSTVGVIGTGSIGSLVCKKYKALGANVIACDIFENEELINEYGIKYLPMKEVFRQSDIISLHMIVTAENERMIDKSYFSEMKDGAYLINVARSELINTDDLYEALTTKKLAGAAMDVFDHEPPLENDIKLASLKNVVATPHLGSYTGKAVDNSVIMSVDALLEALKD